MKLIHLFSVLLGLFLTLSGLYGQEECFYSAPFSSGVMDAEYTTGSSKVFCEIHFDNYGERYSVDLKHKKEDPKVFKSIIRKEGYLYYILHDKKQVLKIPVKERSMPFDSSLLQLISDTTFIGYNSNYYVNPTDSVEAIYYNDLLLYMHDLKNSLIYEVTSVDEDEMFPEFVFFLPRGFSIREMNYNFSK